jgi:glycine/D-amino acid oxidase-like deaminating enzyme
MAAEMALEQPARRAAVLGSGAVGLTAARQLQRRGFDVTIYAATVPPDTTSNMSLAGFTPTSGLIEADRHTPAWDAMFARAAEIGYRQLQLMAGDRYGVTWVNSYNLTDELPSPQGGGGGGDNFLPAHLRTAHQIVLQPGEHPFPTKYAIQRVSMRIEPSIYLDALVRDFIQFGGRIVIRKFETPRDLMSLNEPLVVNCTGLGAGALFGDKEIMPVKGQLTLLVPQPEVNYRTGGGGNGRGVGMNPRADGIALSGTQERGSWSLEPDEQARQRIVGNAIQLFAAMRPPTPGTVLARDFRAPLSIPPLESFFGEDS